MPGRESAADLKHVRGWVVSFMFFECVVLARLFCLELLLAIQTGLGVVYQASFKVLKG